MESPLKDGLPSGKLTLCQPAYSNFLKLEKKRDKSKKRKSKKQISKIKKTQKQNKNGKKGKNKGKSKRVKK